MNKNTIVVFQRKLLWKFEHVEASTDIRAGRHHGAGCPGAGCLLCQQLRCMRRGERAWGGLTTAPAPPPASGSPAVLNRSALSQAKRQSHSAVLPPPPGGPSTTAEHSGGGTTSIALRRISETNRSCARGALSRTNTATDLPSASMSRTLGLYSARPQRGGGGGVSDVMIPLPASPSLAFPKRPIRVRVCACNAESSISVLRILQARWRPRTGRQSKDRPGRERWQGVRGMALRRDALSDKGQEDMERTR